MCLYDEVTETGLPDVFTGYCLQVPLRIGVYSPGDLGMGVKARLKNSSFRLGLEYEAEFMDLPRARWTAMIDYSTSPPSPGYKLDTVMIPYGGFHGFLYLADLGRYFGKDWYKSSKMVICECRFREPIAIGYISRTRMPNGEIETGKEIKAYRAKYRTILEEVA